jgi:hypothetical protein
MASRTIRHAVDTINSQRIIGWCYSRVLTSKAVTLNIYSGKKLIGEVISNEFRKDLLELAVHPTGRCGFTFYFPEGFQLEKGRSLKICTKGLFSCLVESYERNEIAQVSAGELPHIIFMHIPKTAGTSFNAYASQFFPAGKSITHIEEISGNRSDFTRRHNYIAGHLPLGKLAELYPPEHFIYYTIIRDPFEQLHSHLNWLKGIGVNQTSGFYKKHPRVIQKLAAKLNVKKKDIKDMLHSFVENLDGFELDFFDNIQTRYFLDYRPEKLTAEDVRSARKNCSVFKRIGVTESYRQFMRNFCRENGFIYIDQAKPLNKAKLKPLYDTDSPEIKEILFPLVEADTALYDYVTNQTDSGDDIGPV